MSSADEKRAHTEPACREEGEQLRRRMFGFPSPAVEITEFDETPPQSTEPVESAEGELP